MFSDWKMFCLGYLARSHTKLALYIVGYEAGIFWSEMFYKNKNKLWNIHTMCKVILYWMTVP